MPKSITVLVSGLHSHKYESYFVIWRINKFIKTVKQSHNTESNTIKQS
jgi:hypothetical protein